MRIIINISVQRSVQLVAAILAVILGATSTGANEYRYEGQAAYGDQSGTFTDVRTRALSGRYYFSEVDDSSGPLALAPFIARASSIAVFGADRESSLDLQQAFTTVMLAPDAVLPFLNDAYDIFPVDGGVSIGFLSAPFAFSGPNGESDRYGLALDYVIDNSWIVRGELVASDARLNQLNIDRTEDGLSIEVGVGRYVSELLSVTLAYRYTDLDAESTFTTFSCSLGTACTQQTFPFSRGKIEDHAWTLSSRYVLPQGKVFHEFTGAATYGSRSEDVQPAQVTFPNPIDVAPGEFNVYRWELAAGYTFYPRVDWGVGVDVSHLDTAGEQLQTFAVHGTWFVTPAIALGGSYARSNTNSDTFNIGVEDIDGFELSLTGRF